MAPLVPKSGQKKLSTAANLANLLPTGTVLAFQALIPSFTNSGSCITAHKYLTSAAIISLSLVCFISSFTDSFIASNGKLYYGIATRKGLYLFNTSKNDEDNDNVNVNVNVPRQRDVEDNPAQHMEEGEIKNDGESEEVQRKLQKSTKDNDGDQENFLSKYKLRRMDFVHAVCSWLVFVVYAACSSDVHRCFYPSPSDNANALIMNLPLAVGAAVSFLFMLFPTKRRGIGYADVQTLKK